MKILDLTEFYSERGGVRNHLDAKGRILRELGHDHIIVAPGATNATGDLEPSRDAAMPGRDHPERGSGRGSARVLRVAGPSLPYDSNYHLLWRLDKVRNFVMLERPDVLEINSPYLAALALRSVADDAVGLKTFWWHADVVDTYAARHLHRWLGARGTDLMVRPLWALIRAISAGCDATFAASRDQADKLRAHRVERVFHLPFGIDKEVFTPRARSGAWRRGVLGNASEGRILVAMGRLSSEKQWPVVLEGFVRFREQCEAKLVILGDGPERARLERMVEGCTDVSFLGFVSDRQQIATALASADVFVHGCPFETFGLSVAQAIACGSPIVVPDRGGAAELAGPDYAELYRSSDPEAFARALERWSRRDAAGLRDSAIHARDRIFSAREQVQRTVEAYRELLATRGLDGGAHR